MAIKRSIRKFERDLEAHMNYCYQQNNLSIIDILDFDCGPEVVKTGCVWETCTESLQLISLLPDALLQVICFICY